MLEQVKDPASFIIHKLEVNGHLENSKLANQKYPQIQNTGASQTLQATYLLEQPKAVSKVIGRAEFPLMPMWVLTTGSAHTRPSAFPSINMNAKNVGARLCKVRN